MSEHETYRYDTDSFETERIQDGSTGPETWRHPLNVGHLVMGIAFAGMVMVLAGRADYNAPVLAIQKRLRQLLRLQMLNSNLCGAPWWVMWVLVVIGFAGLSPQASAGTTPAWIWTSLAVGLLGMLATWLWAAYGSRGPRDPLARMDDGADGIRRNLRLLDELERFERFCVARLRVTDPPDVVQVGVFGPNRRIVQTRGHRMRCRDLPVLILQHVTPGPLQHPGPASTESCRVLAKRPAATARFDPDHPHFLVGDELVE